MDVPTGWVQIIRGPRPKSVQWPKSSGRIPSSTVSAAANSAVSRAEIGGGEAEVSGIEVVLAALAAAGSTEGPEVKMLQEALQKARRFAQDLPLQEQLSQNELFMERARRRIAAIDVHRAQELAELEKAQERHDRLLQEIAAAALVCSQEAQILWRK